VGLVVAPIAWAALQEAREQIARDLRAAAGIAAVLAAINGGNA
jgi:hypothetical protein